MRLSFNRIAAALFVCAALPYLNILNNQLFLDDLDFILNNAYIRDWRYLPKMFTESMVSGAGKVSDYYRPAIQVAFTAGYQLWELNPMGYHLLSIGFHGLCAVALYRFLDRLLDWPWMAFVVAALFALHPVQTEAVASASALGILMGMFFLLSALLCHMRARAPGTGGQRGIWLALGLLSTAAALLSKETMVTLPGAVFLVEFFFLDRNAAWLKRLQSSLLRSLPYLSVAGVYILLRFTALNFGGTGNLFRQSNVFTESMSARFFTFMTVLLEFFKILLWPRDLFMERAEVMPIHLRFWAAPVMLGSACMAAALALAFLFGRRALALEAQDAERASPELLAAKLVPFGVLWFFFAMVPVSNVLIPISTIMVESWMYTPIVGFLLAAFGMLWLAFARGSGTGMRPETSGKMLLTTLALILGLAGGVRAHRQNRVWKDPVTFYEYTLKHAPQSGRFRNNLAMAYADQKRHQEAAEQYRLAIQINDQYPETHHNLANTYLALGMLPQAEEEFRRAIAKDPRFFHSYLSLASLYFELKRPDLSEQVLTELIARNPSRWEGYYNLGLIHLMKGDRARAQEFWQRARQADPYNPVLAEALKKHS